MRTGDSWQQRQRRKIEQLNEYANALEKREAKLIDALKLASLGYQPVGWTGTTVSGMQRLAAEKLAEVAAMPRPEKPWI